MVRTMFYFTSNLLYNINHFNLKEKKWILFGRHNDNSKQGLGLYLCQNWSTILFYKPIFEWMGLFYFLLQQLGSNQFSTNIQLWSIITQTDQISPPCIPWCWFWFWFGFRFCPYFPSNPRRRKCNSQHFNLLCNLSSPPLSSSHTHSSLKTTFDGIVGTKPRNPTSTPPISLVWCPCFHSSSCFNKTRTGFSGWFIIYLIDVDLF